MSSSRRGGSRNRRRRLTSLAKAGSGTGAPALAARHRAVLRRALRGLPAAVRIASHGQPGRRGECRVAFSLRGARAESPDAGASGAAAGRPRLTVADARGLSDVPRSADAGGGPEGRWQSSRPASSTGICMSGCTTRRLGRKDLALSTSRLRRRIALRAVGGYMHMVARVHLEFTRSVAHSSPIYVSHARMS